MNSKFSPEQWQQAQQIFELVLDSSPNQIPELLTQHCAEGGDLYQAVMQLINQDQALHSFMTEQAVQTLTSLIDEQDFSTDLGRYRLIKKLDQGGMGQIFLAERSDDEFEKQVVIKLIRNDLIYNDVSKARFRHERQILAGLEHPNIARLLDGGSLDNGTPYVVMTYIQGIPITDFCRQQNLSLKQRVHLFLKLCSALEYAHQKLIIHRDIKPGNILVSEDGEPKLLDFGIAIGQDETHHQGLESQSGTPGYASPEQLLGQPQFATSDVYSMGVLLYELVIGQRPFQTQDKTELIAMMQAPIQCEAVWHTNPPGYAKSTAQWQSWHKELSLIIQHALQFKQTARYQTCSELSHDLKNLLNRRPVSVHPANTHYQVRKFIQRNQIPSALGFGLFIALSIFTVFSLIQAKRLEAERDYAISQQSKAEALSGLLLSAFDDADPAHNRGEQVSAREILDQSLRNIDIKLADQPIARIELRSKLSQVYSSLGLYDKALEIAEQAWLEGEIILNANALELIDLKLNLATILSQSGRDHIRINDITNQLLPDLKLEQSGTGERRWRTLKLAAYSLTRSAKSNEAIDIYRQIVTEKKQRLKPGSHSLTESIYELGRIVYFDGFGDEGAKLINEAFDRLDPADPTQHSLNTKVSKGMARLLVKRGEIAKAAQLYENLFQQTQDIFGQDHPSVGTLISNLAETYYRQGDLEKSRQYFEKYVVLAEKSFGPVHINVAFAKYNLASLLESSFEEFEQASILYQQAIKIGQQVYQSKHKNLGYFYRGLGQLYLKQNQLLLAQTNLAHSLANYEYANAPRGRNIAKGQLLMAQVSEQLRDIEQAKQFLSLALPILEKNYPDNNAFVQQAKQLEQQINR